MDGPRRGERQWLEPRSAPLRSPVLPGNFCSARTAGPGRTGPGGGCAQQSPPVRSHECPGAAPVAVRAVKGVALVAARVPRAPGSGADLPRGRQEPGRAAPARLRARPAGSSRSRAGAGRGSAAPRAADRVSPSRFPPPGVCPLRGAGSAPGGGEGGAPAAKAEVSCDLARGEKRGRRRRRSCAETCKVGRSRSPRPAVPARSLAESSGEMSRFVSASPRD